jgi:hypothetical protein
MAKRGSRRQARCIKAARNAANDDVHFITSIDSDVPQPGPPANDNPLSENLPACLEVTDEEVRLLHRHLGRQILALFG